MDELQREFLHGFPDAEHLARVVVRLGTAIFIGGIVGFERQQEGKAAGVRTHMLVALGSALFVLTPLEAGMKTADLSRIIQGIAAGIGFLGAGTIVKLSDSAQVKGLTSAASIWVTAAAGMAAGAGWIWPALIGVGMGWLVLSVLHHLERAIRRHGKRIEEKRKHEDYHA